MARAKPPATLTDRQLRMAAIAPLERLQPALLDRLTDQEPDKKTESRDGRLISPRRFEESVLRDLSWLLNASNIGAAEDLQDHPEVRSSVLNFGIPDFSGLVATGMSTAAIERAVHTAITTFEPRLAKASLRVSVVTESNDAQRNALALRIEAQLWADPAPVSLYMKTELDLENGAITVVGS
jgi:type VI secretion system protein ImpF